MTDPLDPDREAGQPGLPPSDNSDGSKNEGLSEDDLDIDTLISVWKDDLLLDAIGSARGECDRLDVPFDVSADRHLIEALLAIQRDTAPDLLARHCPAGVRDGAGNAVARRPRRRKFRVPLVSTLAAIVVLTFTALAAYGATPDQA